MTSFRLFWPGTSEDFECLSREHAEERLRFYREIHPDENVHIQEKDASGWHAYVPGSPRPSNLKAAARDALQVQDACNSSGVVFALERAMRTLCEVANAEGKGTDWKNSHPIVFLFAHKLLALAGSEDLSDDGMRKYRKATLACEQLTN